MVATDRALGSVGFAAALARYGDVPALIAAEASLTYRDLAQRVSEVAGSLGTSRRLVLVAATNDLHSVIAYLAALAAGHPVLLVNGDHPRHVDAAITTYDPDVLLGSRLEERRDGTAHHLHPDLALLLSTSGSTSSPKLVRLSQENVQSNAAAISAYLALRTDDRAATTLPMHYCYGLSVINSHLLSGASILLTSRTVVDPEFWTTFDREHATSFAAVPHTFDLLERIGFDTLRLPTLRQVTQAGGRLSPELVRRYATLGRRDGWRLFVMYGQTEATARMAYLPAEHAITHPHSVGVPIPGGTITLRRGGGHPDPDVGELIYEGPNVMLGYARTPSDLALGRTITSLATGDLARRDRDGYLEIVGRLGDVVKVSGVRLDLCRAEEILGSFGYRTGCALAGEQLVIALEGGADPRMVRRLVSTELGVASAAVQVCPIAALPRLPTGKLDRSAIAALAEATPDAPEHATTAGGSKTAGSTVGGSKAGGSTARGCTAGGAGESEAVTAGGAARRQARGAPPGSAVNPVTGVADLQALFAEVLGRAGVAGEDTFVGLGGDSLSYVEMCIRLEALLGDLPPDWHVMALSTLAARPTAPPSTTTSVPPAPSSPSAQPRALSPDSSGSTSASTPSAGVPVERRRRAGRVLEVSVGLRAAAIVLVVGTHAHLFHIQGAAHVLVAVAGYNFARFQLAVPDRAARLRHQLRSLNRIVVPSVLWIGGAYLLTDRYGLANVFLLNALTGSPRWSARWDFWFIEVLVLILLLLALLLAVPVVHRFQRRFPIGFATAVLAVGVAGRFEVVGPDLLRTKPVFWLFALGWAIAITRTRRWWRLAVSTVAVATVPGFFGDPARDAVILGGILVLAWAPTLRCPSWIVTAAGLLAAASLHVYLTHWQVFPALAGSSPLLATLASLAVGTGYWRACRVLARRELPVGLASGFPVGRVLGATIGRAVRACGRRGVEAAERPGARPAVRQGLRTAPRRVSGPLAGLAPTSAPRRRGVSSSG